MRVPLPSLLSFLWPFVVSWRISSALLKKWKLRIRLLTLFSYALCVIITYLIANKIRNEAPRLEYSAFDHTLGDARRHQWMKAGKETKKASVTIILLSHFTIGRWFLPFQFHQNKQRWNQIQNTKITHDFWSKPTMCVSSNVLEAMSNGKAHTRRSETAIREANYAAAHTQRAS